jgi:uncharacterized RDD family membrane protein YckC
MYCHRCGAQVDSPAAFCEKCGTALRNDDAGTKSPPPVNCALVEHAGFWKRLAAGLIDGLLLGVAWFVIDVAIYTVYISIAGVEPDEIPESTDALFFYLACLGTIVPGWLYYALMESSAKQATLGKMALGIMVTDTNGRRVSFGRATGRYFAKIISSAILCIGYIMIAFTAKKQGLHDIMADCLVTKKQSHLGNEEGTECTAPNAEHRTTTRLLSVTNVERLFRSPQPQRPPAGRAIPEKRSTPDSGNVLPRPLLMG